MPDRDPPVAPNTWRGSAAPRSRNRVDAARAILYRAIDSRIFPAAIAEVGDSGRALWREAFGTLAFDDPSRATEATIFDLASLTKPLATTSVIMQLVADERIDLGDPVDVFFSEWR